MIKILLLDNYDSFTYNLYHYIDSFRRFRVDVARNDAVDVAEISDYDGIVISPGPGLPSESGKTMEVISSFYSTKRIFGVCLGHQAIAEFFGGTLINLPEVLHGLQTPIRLHTPRHYIFNDLPDTIEVGRYHSWVVNPHQLPGELKVSAVDFLDQIMALYHEKYDIASVQFHPESVMTPLGLKIIENWLLRF